MSPAKVSPSTRRAERIARVRERMGALGTDAVMLSHGADLPWLTGYRAMPLERLTLLVLTQAGQAVLLVPALEAPRLPDLGDVVDVRAWTDSEDPLDLVTAVLPGGRQLRLALSDRAWASTLLGLQQRLPEASFQTASSVTAPLRAVKDDDEIAVLRLAAQAADRVAGALQRGEFRLIGRTERDLSNEISARLIAEGHHQVNFAIVGSGPNAASPHHDAGPRVIGPGEVVVCDFGGELAVPDEQVGYCSDITRTFVTGEPDGEIRHCYEVLEAAQAAGVAAARRGVAAQDVDAAARRVIGDAGFGPNFIHRTGHGIGIEEHEDPYLVEGNRSPLTTGHAFSVEPGIYFPGRWGMRLEDIVVVGDDGPESLNRADHALAVVEA